MEIVVSREYMIFDEWWLGFLITFFTIGISSLIFSFYTAKSIEQKMKAIYTQSTYK